MILTASGGKIIDYTCTEEEGVLCNQIPPCYPPLFVLDSSEGGAPKSQLTVCVSAAKLSSQEGLF